jgi:hypothetical protein
MKNLILFLLLAGSCWGQCGKLVVNPTTGKLDCTGIGSPNNTVTFLLCTGACVVNETTVWKWTATTAITLSACYIDAVTYPTGAALTVDVLKNGATTVFSTTKLVLPAGGSTFVSQTGMAAAATLAAGDYLIGKVTTIGSTIAGQYVNVSCR